MRRLRSKVPPVAELLMVFLLVSSVALTAIPVAGQVEQVIGSPDISANIQGNQLEPSEERDVTISLSNAGEVSRSGPQQFVQRVETARNVRVSIDESEIDAPINIKSGTVTLGTLQSGGISEAVFTVETGEDLEPGSYKLPVRIRYAYTGIVNYEVTQSGYSNIENVDYTEAETKTPRVVVGERPAFSLSDDGASQIHSGGSDYLNFSITNTGTERAEEVTVGLTSQNPAVQFSGGSQSQASGGSSQSQTNIYIPELAPDESYNASVRILSSSAPSVDQYSIQASIEYKTPNGLSGSADPITLGGDIQSGERFSIAGVSGSLYVGEDGNVTATVTNTGPRTAIDPVVNLQAADQELQLQRTSFPIDDLPSGESATVRFPVTVPNDTDSGPYQFGFTVDYEDRTGSQFSSDSLTSEVVIGEERDLFRLENASSTLRAGEEGNVTATVTKLRTGVVDDAVIEFQAPATGLEPQRTTYPVGDLSNGESATVRFPVTATESIDAGPYQFGFTVNYEDADGAQVSSKTLNNQLDVGQQQDVFAVTGTNATLTAGASGPVEIRLTNSYDKTLRNINAKAYVDAPVSASSDESYIPVLEPGESATIAFDMSVASGAAARPRPVEMDFQYEEPDGDTVLSDTYQVPLDITEPVDNSGGGPSAILILVLGVIGVGGAVVAYRRFN
ncbi:COG1361 S-layer family protein [Halosimplex pelagicum]|uniref:CARDB domain-containing protein n=1 Tax=Halosimplex pelagicum TaxID=869886 RepID=A0A7D5PDP9_9EURY|nr:CARDB domain-containing protein [Halosimplex pelagicum]QLH81240.1 hypothetical protein HZS54_06130 [Halosimplex pelagicum]